MEGGTSIQSPDPPLAPPVPSLPPDVTNTSDVSDVIDPPPDVTIPPVTSSTDPLPAPVGSYKSAELPDLSILTHLNDGRPDTPDERSHHVPATYASPNGNPIAWGPVTSTTNESESLSMESVDETATLRAQIRLLQEKCDTLKMSLRNLEREKQDAHRLAASNENCCADLREKNHKLERENDDYLRSIVSANKKTEFYEKNWRQVTQRCQEFEEILRQHGLLPRPDGLCVPPADTASWTDPLVASLKTSRTTLESLLTAQDIKLGKMVQYARKPKHFNKGMIPMDQKAYASMPVAATGTVLTASQGARQKTRPTTLLEQAEEAWPALTDVKPLDIDPTGTKPWCEGERPAPRRWTQDDDGLNAFDRQFKDIRLNEWIRDLPGPDSLSTEDKDYVFVPDSPNLPTGNPNSGCQTFPRRGRMAGITPVREGKFVQQTGDAVDVRGSMAHVHHDDNDEQFAPVRRHHEVSDDPRQCPVCDREFGDSILQDEYERHVAECCEQASHRDISSPQLNSPVLSPSERMCPVCSGDFSSVGQKEFETHVENHFDDDQAAGATARPITDPSCLDFGT